MHDSEDFVQHPLSDKSIGRGGISARINVDGCHGTLDEPESLRLVAEHERGEVVHLDGGPFGVQNGVAAGETRIGHVEPSRRKNRGDCFTRNTEREW
jgi:hypothetical protein